MKIKDLDPKEIYDLTEIKKDAVKFDALKEWLKDNDNGWTDIVLNELKDSKYISYNNFRDEWIYGIKISIPTKCALTLLELDITDYQVDCSELSSEQISNLCNIFEVKGYTLYHTKDALDVINEMKYFRKYYNSFGIFEINLNKTTITYDKFIELFGEKSEKPINPNFEYSTIKDILKDIESNQGYKETQGKCNYELDFDFIQDLAMRIQNEPKYEPYNWQKPMNVEQLSNAMLRHAIEVKKGNFDDNGELGHLLAIAANAMFIYHQKKNNE